MTIDDVKTKLIKIKYDIAKGEIIRHRNFEREEHLMQEEYEAVGMAIASLEAWEEIKQEIKQLADYDTVDTLVDVFRIINKHMQEVTP